MSRRDPSTDTIKKVVRCAIYTRKSTEEGLQQEFNTLDAQRESGEAYIAAQKHEGWLCIRDKYDDGGFTGGNLERPAMKRLLKDIEAGKVDCVIVYKVDRLSRSLMDFSRIMETFDKHKVSFVSVTQAFNTTHSMGRLTLNILLSFAQFEREIISERTRDKIAAARRKGKFAGGKPVLGYDLLSKGILRCSPCSCSMGHTYTSDQTKRYRYYVCLNAQKRGWHTCPSKSVPAGDIERFIIEQIKAIGKDPEVLAQTVRHARSQGEGTLAVLQAEERMLQKELMRHNAMLRKAIGIPKKAEDMAIAQEGIRETEQKAIEVRAGIVTQSDQIVDEQEVALALSVFDPVWETLGPREQARVLHLLLERVDYDGKNGTIAVTFHSNGIKTLAAQCKEAA